MEVTDPVPDEPGEGPADRPQAVSPGRSARRGAVSRLFLLLALVLLLALAVGVIWILPRLVEPVAQLENVGTPAIQSEPEPPTESESQRARFKREAESALKDYLKLQAVLEAQDVAFWGKEEYETALAALAVADAAFANGNFEQAKSGYESAAGMLQSLENSRPEKLAQALAQGASALDRYDVEAARERFRFALAIEPGNKQALAGVDRADKIERVSSLLDQAGESEGKGDIDAARELLEQAAGLDPQSDRARSELERIGGLIEEKRFNQFMSEAFAAVASQRFDAADKALSSADETRPGTAEVADARRRLELAIQEKRIKGHRQRAEKFEQAENWHEVARELDAVLAIDPQAQFAVQGLEQSRRLAALHDQLDAWLQDPERLGSAQPRENARLLLDSPVPQRLSGPGLNKKFDQLAALLALAETPVLVRLESDGVTNIIINRVGRFGAFTDKTVELLPGTYVVRGERAGYRDVRLELKVSVQAVTPTLVVRCEEKI